MAIRNNLLFWCLGAIGVILDQLSKWWVLTTLRVENRSLEVWANILDFTYVRNDGAAWSFFEGGVHWLRWISLAVSVGLGIFVWRSKKLPIAEQVAYGFILAGALGNGIDRFLHRYVVDFIHVQFIQFPVFNLADIWINLGVITAIAHILYLEFRSQPPSSQP